MAVIPLFALASEARPVCTGQYLVFTVWAFKSLQTCTRKASLCILQEEKSIQTFYVIWFFIVLQTTTSMNPILFSLKSICSAQSVNWVIHRLDNH